MRTFTKLCLLIMVLTFSTSLIAQQSISSYTGNASPDKMELIRQIHGSNVIVPLSPEGSSKAIGDDCSNPILINSLPYTDLGQTTTGRGNNYDNTCLNDFDGGEDIIYQLELASATIINVTLDPLGTARTGVALSDGCPISSLCLAMSYDLYNNGASEHGFTVSLDAGIYFIMVDTWPGPLSIPAFNLIVEEVTTVANDECEDAIEVGEIINLEFSTELATASTYGETTGPDIWFKYTAGITGVVAVDLCGSDYDTDLVVWEGGTCPPSIIYDQNDDACGYNGLQSKVFLNVNVGDVFLIEIGGFNGNTGEGLLSIYQAEDCALTCPPGGILESEACGDDTNGGCNMAVPSFINVVNGNTICGNLGSQLGNRDTDWFRLVLNSPGSIKMNVKTEENVVFGLVGQVVLGLPGCDNTTDHLSVFKVLPSCSEDFIQVVQLPKGTYYFFIAPLDYFSHPCPGFSYQASFEIEELASGFINGNVLGFDVAAGIGGVKVSAGAATTTTNALGNYILEVPLGSYTVKADGYDVGYSSASVPNVVVTENNFTVVNFVLDALPAPVLLTADADIELVELTWEPIGSKAEGSKTLMGDIFALNEYVPGDNMEIDFKMTIYSPDFEWGVYAEIELPEEFTILSVGDLNGVAGDFVGQKASWTGLFYDSEFPEEIEFFIEVAVDGNAEGPLVATYYVQGDEFGLEPHYFEGALTIYEEGGTYVPTFNVYRKLGPIENSTYFIPIAYGVIGNYYLDEIYPGGMNWCYLVKQILPDGSESVASNHLCVTTLIRPGSLCETAIDYGQVNDPAISESLVRADDERWFEFDVPYTMDIAVLLDNTEFDADVTLYADCDGTLLVEADDYCGDAGYDVEKIYTLIPGGTYFAKITSLGGDYGSFDIFITQVQLLTIREGWSGFSIYMDVAGDPNIASQLDCLKDDMVITVRQTPYGIWWPSQNLNSIGNIYNTYGYKSKMDVERTTVIFGSETPDKTVVLPKGASYLPVRVTAPVDANDIVNALVGKFIILYDIKTNQIIWPDGLIFPGHPASFEYLMPGVGYLINMTTADSYTYPMPTMSPAPPVVNQPAQTKFSTWNEVVNTGNPHFFSIQNEALSAIEFGDVIGVFNADDRCVGLVEYNTAEGNLFLAAFGDDELTDIKDGLTVGETMTFKLFRASNNTKYDLEVVYADHLANADGLFQIFGMSMIVELKVGSTSIQNAQLSSVGIYPNPTTGLVNISGVERAMEVILTNVQGQEISRTIVTENATIDLSTQSKGVYFIRLMTDNSTRIEKIILK